MNSSCTRGRPQRGATLIEMIVTLAIAVILMSIATPSMLQAMIRQDLRVVRDELAVAMQLAEIESARRGVPVILERQTGCAVALAGNGDWSCGYRMYADANRNNLQDTDEPSVRVVAGEPRVQLLHTNGGTASIVMNPWGRASGGLQRFVAASTTRPNLSMTVCLNTGGNVRDFTSTVPCP